MNAVLRNTLAVAAAMFATQAAAQVTFYERENFQGRSFTTERQVRDFQRFGFNDRASSAVVARERWEICEDVRYGGRCIVLRPGRYASLAAMGLSDRVSSVRAVNASARIDDGRYAPMPVAASQITFFANEGFQGQSFTTQQQVRDFQRFGFNDRASSAVVEGERWEVCVDSRYRGRCVVLRPGRYGSLAAMGLSDRVSSVRTVDRNARIDDSRYAPAPGAYAADRREERREERRDFRRRNNERLYEAPVTSVRAVVGPPEQRCWIEREQVSQPAPSGVNVPATIAGAVIGGILGHQIGSGDGRDLTRAGGAVAGGFAGAHIGRSAGGQVTTQDVQKCASVPSTAAPQFWDVTYNFRGVEHRVQMTGQPGPTVTVNEQGEPRAN